ncbi:MAG: response regulator [Calditrichaceae bacterium]|nr:response regulator [Calditrichaceae bacterium]
MKRRTSSYIQTMLPVEDNLDAKTLSKQLEVERFLFHLVRNFIHFVPEEIDLLINESLEELVKFIKADRGYIYKFINNNRQIELSHSFMEDNIPGKIPMHDRVDSEDFSWLIRPLLDKQTIKLSTSSQLPSHTGTIRAIMEVEETKSMLICPMVSHKQTVGFIGVDMTRQAREWQEHCEYLLKYSGDVFLGALEGKRTIDIGKQTEQKLRSLFDRTEDVIFISSPDDRVLEINPAGIKLLGYDSLQEILSLDIKKDLYVNPEDRDRFKKIIQEKGQIRDYEVQLKRRDGKEIFVLETTKAVYNEQGNVVAYEGIMRDVTDRRQLESQLFQAQKMESIGLLAGGIAHDFNNILTAINGYAEMILMNMDPSNAHYKNILNILKGGKRAENLIRQLLAFSRKQMIEPKVLDINHVISDLHKMLDRLIGEDIKFDLQLKKGLKSIKADPVQIQQVLVNLVVNGVHAVKQIEDPAAKKEIAIHTSEASMDDKFISLNPGSKKGNYVLIRVKDTGVGMDEITKQKIFEPFFTTKKNPDGTGLGLSTVYGIVKQNDGYIKVDSLKGTGTEFLIFWPITTEKKVDSTERESSVEFGLRSETIMVVEDDHDVRDLASSALKSFGYKVIEAENGRIALQIINKNNLINKIDILLTDMVMPEMGGQELAAEVRKLNKKIKIILSSGYTDSQILNKEVTSENGYYFLTKPYSIKQLEKKIKTVLQL